MPTLNLAVLDDYQGLAHTFADFTRLEKEHGIKATFFTDMLGTNPLPSDLIDRLVERLLPFDIILCMRERTPMPRQLLESLPNLKLLFTTGMGNASFDMKAATKLGIVVCGTQMLGNATAELTWGLILGILRKIPQEDRAFKDGGWQTKMGFGVQGKTLGLVGLGRLGIQVAKVGLAFGMKVLAWSPNLNGQRIRATGLEVHLAPSLDHLLSHSDVVSLHLVLSASTHAILSASKLALLKPTSFLINTSRGALIDQEALCDLLESGSIAGAALDTFEVEPVPNSARIRQVAATYPDRIVVTPHVGYVEAENYKVAYESAVGTIERWAKGGWKLPLLKGERAEGFTTMVLNKDVTPRQEKGAKL